MNTQPLITAIVSTYNSEEFIYGCIEDLQSQTIVDKLEIIVVNSNSQQNEQEIITRLQKKYDNIKYIETPTREGLYTAWNRAIRVASGKYITNANTDDRHRNDSLEIMLNELETNDDIALVYGDQIYTNVPNDTFETTVSFKRRVWAEYTYQALRSHCMVSSQPMWRKDLHLKYGYFDETFYSTGDWEFWLRIGNTEKFKKINDVLGLYYENPQGIENSYSRSKEEWQRVRIMYDIVDAECSQSSFQDYFDTPFYKSLMSSDPKIFNLIKSIVYDAAQVTYNKESEINKLYSDIKIYNKEIHALNIEVNRLKDDNNILFNQYRKATKSFSWKITYPIRAISELCKKIKLKYRSIVYSKNCYNSVWPIGEPFISVVIPCFNYGQYINDAINSVLKQTYQNFEIIVVDGGSTDGITIDILNNISKPKTKVYFREGRHLVGDNRNFGIEKARGKYICCLDADDMLMPTYFEKALFLAEAYNSDIVYPWVKCFGSKDVVWAPTQTSFLACLEGSTLSTVAIFKRDAWAKVGGYKDWGLSEEHVPEDWEFWVRLLGHGYRAKLLPEPLMHYRVHGSGLTANNKKSIEEQKQIIRHENNKLLNKDNLQSLRKNNRINYIVHDPFINLRFGEKESKSVLIALPFMVIGGADNITLKIIEHLRQNGYDIYCITSLTVDHETMGDNSIRYERISNGVYNLANFLSTERERQDFIEYLIYSKQIDIIYIIGCELVYNMLTQIKNLNHDIKIVDQLFNEFGHIDNNRKYRELIDMNVVTSNIISDILINKYAESADKIKVIVHGVDVDKEFNPSSMVINKCYTDLPINNFIVGFFGRFSEEKCPGTFVEIAHHLKGLSDIYWVMTGCGPEYSAIKDKIKDMSLSDKIYAPGFVEDNKSLLLQSHVVVIPSRIEGIPIILMEALALGIPVIASNVGGIPSVIVDGYNGFLCSPGDVSSFADKVKLLYDDPKLLDQMKKNAREYAECHLDINNMKNEYLDTFNALFNQ